MEIGWTKENIFVYLPALIGSLLWEGLARSAEVAGQEWNEGRGHTKIKKKRERERESSLLIGTKAGSANLKNIK